MNRILPRCAHFGLCGGCLLQDVPYPDQVDEKRKRLEALLREGDLQPAVPISAIGMEDPWAYRSKMEFTFGQDGDRITLGLHQRASFQKIVEILRCEIASPAVNELLTALREGVNRSGLKAYHPKTHQGFWRYAVVRASRRTGDLMLLLITHEGSPEAMKAMAEFLPRRVPALKSLYWGVSTKVSDVAVAERMELVWGAEKLEDQVGPVRFEVGPTNFVQPNLLLASQVYRAIASGAGLTGREAVYDLYCGIGLIALSLAPGAKVVYGVESERENVASAECNARLNGISHAVFVWGKLEHVLKNRALFQAGPKADVIVLDPPRPGLHPDVFAPVLEAGAAKLLYLSCNPVSLARDLKILLGRDSRYRLSSVQMFDFFPHTAHLEALAVLSRS